MDATFSHPIWIYAGLLLVLAGYWLFRWSSRNSAASEIANATKEAALHKLFKGNPGDPPPAVKKLPEHHFRRAIAQFLGIVGFLLIIAGLMAALLGIFYQGVQL